MRVPNARARSSLNWLAAAQLKDDAVDALVRSAPGERDRVVARGRARHAALALARAELAAEPVRHPRALNEPVCWRSSALSDRPGASRPVKQRRPSHATADRLGRAHDVVPRRGIGARGAILDRRWALHAPARCRARSPTPAPRMRRWIAHARTLSGSSHGRPGAPPADRGASARARAPPSPLGDALRRGGVRLGFVVWLAVLSSGRAPGTLHRARRVRPLHGAPVGVPHARRLPYPSFTGDRLYPIDLEIDGPCRSGGVAPPSASSSPCPPSSWPRPSPARPRSEAVRHRDRPRRRRPRHGGRPPRLVRLAGPRRDATGHARRGRLRIGYGAQVTAYAYLLTDRYPDAAPGRLLPGAQPRPPRGAHRLRRPGPAAPHRRLPSTSRAAAPVLADALGGPGRARGGRGVGRSTRRRPRPARAPPLPGRVRPTTTHVSAFLYVVGRPYPGFVGGEGTYPIDLTVAAPDRQRRLGVLVRVALALPALLSPRRAPCCSSSARSAGSRHS